MVTDKSVREAYDLARESYGRLNVDPESAIEALRRVSLSIHCWQGDDVGGFETPDAKLEGGGIQVTGNYPGRARSPEELRADLGKALSVIPGSHRVNLHAIYGEFGGRRVERNEIGPEHFAGWVDWARAKGLGLDFNGTFFSHPKAASGFTLSSRDEGVRRYWVEHAASCREIGAFMGRALGAPTVVNIWIPDGSKDAPVDRLGPRERLKQSLDEILAKKFDRRLILDAVEGKLFGIGSESYVVGSHEFYLGYAVANNILLCLDTGHFHPTETVADKISALMPFVDELLLHVSRGVRWDSDHVVILSDDLRALAEELVRGDFLGRVRIGLDYFDASINRVAAWAIGARAMLKALLIALLEPSESLRELESVGDGTGRLAMLEELKTLPFGAVWDYYCLTQGVPVGPAWLVEITQYEKDALLKR